MIKWVAVFVVIFTDGTPLLIETHDEGTRNYFDTIKECQEYILKDDPVPHFLQQFPIEMFDSISKSHCTKKDIIMNNFPDYPEYNQNVEPEKELST